MNFMDVTMLPD